jgi:hypothetical protein
MFWHDDLAWDDLPKFEGVRQHRYGRNKFGHRHLEVKHLAGTNDLKRGERRTNHDMKRMLGMH